MWEFITLKKSQITEMNIESILSGKNSALVIKNFYDENTCKTLVNRIKNYYSSVSNIKKSKHIGPFLMSYITTKEEYFEDSKQAQKIFGNIFSGIKTPSMMIYKCISKALPNYSISLATENKNRYSPFVIRIHQKGTSIPVHKDNIAYEGREYDISDIDEQLSCVLHLQESENGGEPIMYNKLWKKQDEQFRNINFGYSSNLISSENYSKISSINMGDLVIINPKYYHRVTELSGNTTRITLGMFLGLYRKNCKIVTWA